MFIEFTPTEKQAEALKYWMDDETTEIWFWWAAGWAKSWLWVFAIFSACLELPWSRWVIWRKELINLRRTTLATYWKMLKFYNVPKERWGELNWQTNTIKFPNGSEILLLDCAAQTSDPEWTRFWSLELTGAFIDEANEVDAKWVQMLKTRIGRQNTFTVKDRVTGEEKTITKCPKFLECFNPNKWHVYNDYYKPWKDWTLPSYRKFVRATVGDNPYISKSYIEQLERSDEITKQRLLYGNFDYDDTPWKLFRWDEITDLFTANILEDNTTYITCDVARLWEDKTVIIVWKGMHWVEVKPYQWQTTDQTVAVIKDLESYYHCRRSHICIDSDWVWWWVADQLRWCINFVNNSSPILQWDEKKNYSNLKTQCYFKLKYILEKREMHIDASGEIKERIENELDNILIKDVDNDNKIKMETKEDMKKRLWHSPDYADAIMMRMYWEINKSNSPITKTDVITINFDDLLY